MAGLLEWSNSIRYTMANDPGRQFFQDQLNTHGFIFLDDYLDNILSGPCQDPLIELVKTPGRKKVSKKAKDTGASKLNNLIFLEGREEFKENVAPINNFNNALLKAKDQAAVHATNPLQPDRLPQGPITDLTTGDDIFSTTSSTSVKGSVYTCTAPNPLATELLVPSRSEQNNLSVIAEDDENFELNPYSRRLSHQAQLVSSPPAHSGHGPLSTAIAPHDTNLTESTTDTFHSITLDSPRNEKRQDSPNPPISTPPTTLEPCEVKLSHATESHAPHIPDIRPGTPTGVQEKAMLAFLSTSAVEQDINVPIRVHDHTLHSPKSGDNKFGVALFPALPAPIPLRKSMRAPRDPSISVGHLGAATPGAPPGGKRTSWLKKAREVKALEVTSKHTSTQAPPVPSSSAALKRKSGDLLMDPGMTGLEDDERCYKSAKNHDGDVAPLTGEAEPQFEPPPQTPTPEHVSTGQEGMLDRFRRTVEDLGAKVGKSMSKSLGAGAAVSALAEARAAAEARVAERHYKEEEMTRVAGPAPTFSTKDIVPPADILSVPSEQESGERRLSVSDLFPPNDGSVKMKSKSEKHYQSTNPVSRTPSANLSQANRQSTTTTPPDSPPITRPASASFASGPVFNKPPPVFVPPVLVSKPMSKGVATNLPSSTTLSTHVPTSVGITSHLASPSSFTRVASLSNQYPQQSAKSDTVFHDTDLPAWMPTLQDTGYSSAFGSQSQIPHQTVLDEDDSWPLDEKLAAGVQWTFGSANAKEDSMTWSTLPSQSQRADTSTSHHDPSLPQRDEPHPMSRAIPGAFDIGMNDHEDTELAIANSEPEDMAMRGTSTVNNVEPKATRSESQMSMASSQSSQSQTGFLGQASKLLNSALGTSKKGKPEVKKVLQMAAAAAKKQQEENDKKAARLREMENRRQLAIQRKAEEEKTRALEHERKVKEEGERRKREREETTDKRPLKGVVKKDEDTTKKRKVTVTELEKKEVKKLPSKSALKFSLKQPSALSSSAAYNASLQNTASSTSSKPVDPKVSKTPVVAFQKGKGNTTPKQLPVPDDDLSQPSHLVQIQMAARAKAQLQAANLASEIPVASESIELPEINSEYSDSEDEDRPKSFPEWAQSPELREALQLQSTINPDDIFGAIRPLRMEELFKTRTSRFRARTSSANWTGADRLTLEEEREYAKRMGFK